MKISYNTKVYAGLFAGSMLFYVSVAFAIYHATH